MGVDASADEKANFGAASRRELSQPARISRGEGQGCGVQEAETDLQRGLSDCGRRRMKEEEEDVCVWRRVRMGKKIEE